MTVVPFIDEKRPAKKYVSPIAQPVFIRPSALVDPNRVSDPSEALESRVEVEGSSASGDVESSNKSRPANVPARPT